MKKVAIFLSLTMVCAFSARTWADGGAPEASHHRVHSSAQKFQEVPPAPVCTSKSANPKVRLVAWDPKQKVDKFLGELQECVTTQWDVLKMLSGPNTIGLHYPEEHEMWGYLWLWNYKLQNPIGDTIIEMDHPGKRVQKGKNPVELRLTFNSDDVLERVEMDLIKKKNSDYVLFP